METHDPNAPQIPRGTGRILTKTQRRKLRELGALAHERDLSAELAKLEAEFRRWRAGDLGAAELSDAIHRFHQGPARELFSRYEPSNLRFAVADAIHRGVITSEEAGDDVVEMLQRPLALLRDIAR